MTTDREFLEGELEQELKNLETATALARGMIARRDYRAAEARLDAGRTYAINAARLTARFARAQEATR